MKDNILGVLENSICPKCGSENVFCYLQYPLIVKKDMKGKIVRNSITTGKRMKLSNEYMANEFETASRGEMQVAQYKCDQCGWISKPYTP